MADKERVEKLKLLLKDLFQFENHDLDFGIYRIINIKRKEISEFIDKELFEIIKDKIKTVEDNTELQKDLETLKKEIEETFGCDIQEAKKKYAETPKVKDYVENEKELEVADKENDVEEEIYDDIINFFSRYYDKGDFISKRRYSKDYKYAIPYNGEEVYLYWANNDQYYIKTGEDFKNYSFKTGNLKVNFEIVSEEVDVEKNNIKDTEKKFFIFHDAEYDSKNKVLSIRFGYRGLTEEEEIAITELTNKKRIGKDEVNEHNLTQINEKIGIYGLSDLQKKHTKMDGEKSEKSELEWHLNKYTTKNTTDYFIHKNLKKFLNQELDFYIKNELLHIDDIDSKENLNINLKRVKVFKEISVNIIEFLSQIEEFQKKLWEKKKFVISTDYCITLDYVDEKYYLEILKNKAQLEEWKRLFSFDVEAETKKLKGKLTGAGKGEEEKKIPLLKDNPTLTIDTKFYDVDFKYQLLSEINNLDEKTTGILIHSENFQALSLLLNKYKEKIKCCYIDPPYNTGNDGFLYKDGFNHSSWLSMMEDRLYLSKMFLNRLGIIFTNIDDNEIDNLIKLKKRIFNEELVEVYVWDVREQGTMPKTAKKTVRKEHEYIITAFKDEKNLNRYSDYKYIDKEWSNPDNDPRGPWMSANISRGSGEASGGSNTYTITNPEGISFKRDWSINEEEYNKLLADNRIYFSNDGKGVPRKKIFQNEPIESIQSSIFEKLKSSQSGSKEIKDLFNISILQYPKPTELIKRLCKIGSSNNNNIIIDFFAGSGTTGHAVLKLNKADENKRKFILVEMGQYFESVLKPRILKVIYSDNWKNGEPQDNDGSTKQIIKYQTLEQYEDSLNNIDFKEAPTLAKESKDYKIKYMLEFESKGSNVLLNLDALDNPFEYKLKVEKDNEFKESNIDLVETFNYIAGINVKSIKKMNDDKVNYVVVKGHRNEKDVIVIWRNKNDGFDPKKDKEFVEKEILKEEYDEILVNGNSLL
ncbi:MAG: site-specific DNA-methyltransferase [Candidatus Heimdallarchaeota archaeon]|nr:site-specific DNA-methyltransferase [Candidatus Heimdallarchaeota archaeon]